ncbi:hypothetical protein B9Z55_021897 [Caenorhabditis nigoni]|uniref:C2H2-type domain-containing protein n=1 Tax=Caenorhabditis nigoni TaxID=1611254 RepID=A0A2G5TUK1_9PELO|nr:hypothetical protein B9Z55_021897 [Caenorhabditis nigoni]
MPKDGKDEKEPAESVKTYLFRTMKVKEKSEMEKNQKSPEPPTTPVKKQHVPFYKCAYCNYKTDDQKRLKRHTIAHQKPGNSMPECDVCHAQFSHKFGLKRHQMSNCKFEIFEDSGESENFEKSPEVGSKTFEVSENLRMSNQEVWPCLDCQISYTDETIFVLHRLFHTKNAPFQCSICSENCENAYFFMRHVNESCHSSPGNSRKC